MVDIVLAIKINLIIWYGISMFKKLKKLNIEYNEILNKL